jgi:8-oxo-dGTP pyrophosphatase MutT (NUDIX family)
MGRTWQGFHTRVDEGETAVTAAQRAVQEFAGLTITGVYSADYINQFYDESRDAVVLAPVLAVTVSTRNQVTIAPDFGDFGWVHCEEAVTLLPFSGQRWAVRHIDEIMSIGEEERELYRLQTPAVPTPAPAPAQEEPATV